MKRRKQWSPGQLGLLALGVVINLVGQSVAATDGNATTIRYTVESLGGSVYQYDYKIYGGPFGFSTSSSGFDVYFDPLLYASLEAYPVAPSSDWFVFTTPPDTVLPSNGSYTAEATVDGASIAMPFSVSFTWLGKGTPGSQSFDVIDSSFNVIEQGRTTAADAAIPMPEPGSFSLTAGLVTGLIAFGVWRPLGRVSAYRKV